MLILERKLDESVDIIKDNKIIAKIIVKKIMHNRIKLGFLAKEPITFIRHDVKNLKRNN